MSHVDAETLLPLDYVRAGDAPARRPGGPVPAGRSEAARQMEALFLSLLVKEMRRTLPGKGIFGTGPGSAVYEGFFDTLIAEAMAAGRGLGLREVILDSLEARDPGAPAGPSDAAAASDKEEVSEKSTPGPPGPRREAGPTPGRFP